MCVEPRAAFYQHMDAVNSDLKAFSERLYKKMATNGFRGAGMHSVFMTTGGK